MGVMVVMMIAFCLYASTERQQAAQATGQEEGGGSLHFLHAGLNYRHD